MSVEAPSKPLTTQRAFEIVCGLMSSKKFNNTPVIQQRVTAHLRAVTAGKFRLLVEYHNSPDVSDEDKLALYKDVTAAIMKNNLDSLKGNIAKGDKRADVMEVGNDSPPATKPEPTPELERHPLSASRPETPPVKIPFDSGNTDPGALIAEALRRMAMQTSGPLDENRVEQIAKRVIGEGTGDMLTKLLGEVDDKVKHAMNNGSFPVDRVKAIAEEVAKKYVIRIEMVSPTGEVKPVEGLVHRQLTQIHRWIAANVPVWAWGAAGAGKTHFARQVAELEGIAAHILSVDPTLTVSKLVGYRNLVDGTFVEGLLYKPFKDGGLMVFDEIDTGDPAIIACLNALIANEYYLFPNGETAKKHDKFRVLALANTKGTGAVAGYTARNRLDAATLDRFAVIELKYDETLEMAIACGVVQGTEVWKPGPVATPALCEKWVRWVQAVRNHVGNSVLISPRASILGVRALRVGIPITDVADALVFKLVTDDTRKRITEAAGEVTTLN